MRNFRLSSFVLILLIRKVFCFLTTFGSLKLFLSLSLTSLVIKLLILSRIVFLFFPLSLHLADSILLLLFKKISFYSFLLGDSLLSSSPLVFLHYLLLFYLHFWVFQLLFFISLPFIIHFSLLIHKVWLIFIVSWCMKLIWSFRFFVLKLFLI